MRIGEQLLQDGAIDPATLETALTLQQRRGGRLGDILTCLYRLAPLALHRALARQQRLPFADLRAQPPDPALLDYRLFADYHRLHALPWRRAGDRLVIAAAEINAGLTRWAEAHYTLPLTYAVATPRDIRQALAQRFAAELDAHARRHLAEAAPLFSAHRTVLPAQWRGLAVLCTALLTGMLWLPSFTAPAALYLINLFYLGTNALKLILYYAARPARPSAPLSDADLPIYSILIPLYREAEGIPRLLAAMDALDYPKDRLDIKLVAEADDAATLAAIKQAAPAPYYDLIEVPPSQPRTKPKACDVALRFVRGEFVTIYDAEDRPHPQQLRQAVAAFRVAAPRVACFQARLNYDNWNENLLTRLFAIEYAALFDCLLPGLQRLAMPIPLGGTSNHLRTAVLRQVGAWDPYNVTEDADLGMRLAYYGYQTRMLDSVTMEESPIALKAWIAQRTRWIKGYMQSWLVIMRRPGEYQRRLGPAGFYGAQFFIGGPCFVFLLAPVLWGLAIGWLTGALPGFAMPDWLYGLCYFNLAFGLGVHWWLARRAVHRWRWHGMQGAMLLYPFYWLLHSVAAWRALWQLIRRPHFWDKTTHGVSALLNAPPRRTPHR